MSVTIRLINGQVFCADMTYQVANEAWKRLNEVAGIPGDEIVAIASPVPFAIESDPLDLYGETLYD